MRIRVKKLESGYLKRIDSDSEIDSIELKEDFMDEKQELFYIYFKGKDSSGILNLKRTEALSLLNSLKPLLDLSENKTKIIPSRKSKPLKKTKD